MENRQAMLRAFDRLFAKTADKLQIPYSPGELAEATEQFAERLEQVLDVISTMPDEALPGALVDGMENAIEELSPIEVVGQVAALPLLRHSQALLQRLARNAAEQQLIEHALEQADTSYGGN